jgi:signal transduction histidine kinase
MNDYARAAILCAAAGLLAIWATTRRQLRHAAQESHRLRVAHAANLRLLRLAASDQRNIALTLFGHAQKAAPANSALTGLARRLLDMSEDLISQTDLPTRPRTLFEESVALAPALEFAIAQVASHLGPSRRVWRIAPELEHIAVIADRRAFNQVLVNVFSGAAAATRDGDWIEISPEAAQADWAMAVQDEGIGLPVTEAGCHQEESRGIGLQLTLARSLMQAHGGSLTVESKEHVGTRVRLGFPKTRLLDRQQAVTLAS